MFIKILLMFNLYNNTCKEPTISPLSSQKDVFRYFAA